MPTAGPSNTTDLSLGSRPSLASPLTSPYPTILHTPSSCKLGHYSRPKKQQSGQRKIITHQYNSFSSCNQPLEKVESTQKQKTRKKISTSNQRQVSRISAVTEARLQFGPAISFSARSRGALTDLAQWVELLSSERLVSRAATMPIRKPTVPSLTRGPTVPRLAAQTMRLMLNTCFPPGA